MLGLGRLAVGIPTTQDTTASLALVRMLHDPKMPLPILTDNLQASQSGDYYHDTNMTYKNSPNPNLRPLGSQHSHSNISSHRGQRLPLSQFSPPLLPIMPLCGGPGSATGSDYQYMSMGMPPMESPDHRWLILMRALFSQPSSVLLGKSRVALFHGWCSSDVGLFYECFMRSSLE